MNQHYVVIPDRIEDDVVTRREARNSGDKSGRWRPMRGYFANSQKRSLMLWTMRIAVSMLPLSRAMCNQMSSSWASAWPKDGSSSARGLLGGKPRHTASGYVADELV